MKKILLIALALCVLLVYPATSLSSPSGSDKSNAARQCKAERSAMGANNFKVLYGTNKNDKNAFGKCVSKKAKINQSRGNDVKSNAAKQCKAEQLADPVAFKLKYDPQGKGNKAYGSCVSKTAKLLADQNKQKDQSVLGAEKQCRAEQVADANAFNAKYGTATSKGKNAFGKCVSLTASS